MMLVLYKVDMMLVLKVDVMCVIKYCVKFSLFR